jgi:hypothetical protein
MSVPVALEGLREEIDHHGSVAYFLSVGDDGRPHTVQLVVALVDGGELVVHPGNSTVRNAEARPLVSVLWPPTAVGGYSLIVDGTVSAVSGGGDGENSISVQPTKAVLHRPAKSDDPNAASHGSDCVGVFSASS